MEEGVTEKVEWKKCASICTTLAVSFSRFCFPILTSSSSSFVELARKQIRDGSDDSLLIRPISANGQRRAYACSQHHHTHDALGVDLATAADQPYGSFESLNELHQLGRRTRMQAELVGNDNLLFKHK